uniref:FBA_2 domain-containing protein n=1 Tax=Caenorhabditis tropicalis TaxID=1561998 RepID=A0A1I7U1B8_9PELO
MFELFMNGLQRSVGELITHQKDGKGYKNLNFQVNTYFFADPCLWFNLEFLLSMDSKGISIHTTNFSAEDLNVFLRSWQEGKTNWNLEQVKLRTYYARDMKEVLKGCKGEYMDPRTTKLSEPRSQGYQWIYGGIHIRRNDGRLAVIQTGFDDYYVEDNGASEREIRTYLATRQVWESENSRYAWCEHWFRIYVF